MLVLEKKIRLTFVHGAQHARSKLIDSIAFLHEWHQRRDSALVVGRGSKVCKNELLELIHLILQIHELANRLVSEVGLVRQREKAEMLEQLFPSF